MIAHILVTVAAFHGSWILHYPVLFYLENIPTPLKKMNN